MPLLWTSPVPGAAHTSPPAVFLTTLWATWLCYFAEEEIEVWRGEPFGLRTSGGEGEPHIDRSVISWRLWNRTGVGVQAGKSLECLSGTQHHSNPCLLIL